MIISALPLVSERFPWVSTQIILKDNAMVTGRHIYGPFLLLLPPDQLAVITLHATIMSMMLGEKVRLFKHNKKTPSAGINTVTIMAVQIGRVRSSPYYMQPLIFTSLCIQPLGRGPTTCFNVPCTQLCVSAGCARFPCIRTASKQNTITQSVDNPCGDEAK